VPLPTVLGEMSGVLGDCSCQLRRGQPEEGPQHHRDCDDQDGVPPEVDRHQLADDHGFCRLQEIGEGRRISVDRGWNGRERLEMRAEHHDGDGHANDDRRTRRTEARVEQDEGGQGSAEDAPKVTEYRLLEGLGVAPGMEETSPGDEARPDGKPYLHVEGRGNATEQSDAQRQCDQWSHVVRSSFEARPGGARTHLAGEQ
jgi:hypothetical protein